MNSSLPPSGKSVIATETAGMTASTACALHCIAFPWLATVSAFGSIIPQLHFLLAVLSLVFAMPLFFHVRRGMLSWWVGALAGLGCVSLMLGMLIHDLEVYFTVFGAGVLLASHLTNLSFHRRRHKQEAAKSCCDCSSRKS